jgi:hypothetical protein
MISVQLKELPDREGFEATFPVDIPGHFDDI